MRHALIFFFLVFVLACKSSVPSKSDATITNTYWKLTSMNGNVITTPENHREAHIILSLDESKLKGHAGCNSIGGSYALKGDSIRFTAFSTKMMCDERIMAVESYLLNALSVANQYNV